MPNDNRQAATQVALGRMLGTVEGDRPFRILWVCDEPGQIAITARSKNSRPFLITEYIRHGGFEVYVLVTDSNDLEVTTAALNSYVNGIHWTTSPSAVILDTLKDLAVAVKDWDHVITVIDQEAEEGVGDRPGDHMAVSDLERARAGVSAVNRVIGRLKGALGIK